METLSREKKGEKIKITTLNWGLYVKPTDLNKSKSFIKCRTNYTNLNFCYSLFNGFWHGAGEYCQQFSSMFLSAILIYFHFIRAKREFGNPPKKSKLNLLQTRGKVWQTRALPFPAQSSQSSLWNAGARDTSSPQKLHLHIKGWNSTAGPTQKGKLRHSWICWEDMRFTHQHFRALDWGNYTHTVIFQWQWITKVEIKYQLYFLYGSCNYCCHMQTIQNKPILLACSW